MCGIVFRISQNEQNCDENEWDELVRLNAQRGPNSQRHLQISAGSASLNIFSSVLHLRGDHIAVQPHHIGENLLCWNGEVFEGLDFTPADNDGVKLFECLNSSNRLITDILGEIEGPYAFVHLEGKTRTVYFGRDPLGRRSLVVQKPSFDRPYLTIASVSNGNNGFEELPADTLFSVSLDDQTLSIHAVSRGDPSSQLIAPKPLRRELPSQGYQIPVDPLPSVWNETVEEYIRHLDSSVELRTQDIPRLSSVKNSDARVAVLFSGGIDSSVVAFLAHRHLPPSEPIDLLNVAFENPRSLEGNTQPTQKKKPRKEPVETRVSEERKYSVPDRCTGLTQVEEFRRLAPERTWNFVNINIPYEESLRCRPMIEQLMAPSRTIMDFSLAQALYFASRGVGYIEKGDIKEPYTSTARVILSGLGADELLGGYIRHRNAYKHAGWQGLLDELQLDVDRIHTRNLGRDDRVISTHGKEARYPFLSMNLLAYLSSLPIHIKVDPRVTPNTQNSSSQTNSNEQLMIQGLPGDKLLHRLAARRLGLHGAATRAKRAMQFGSRSARMEGGEGTKRLNGTTLLS